MTLTAGWARAAKAGLAVRFRLTPRSSLDRIDGVVETAEGPALQARVRAAPSDGEANDALVRLVAEWMGLPKSRISVTQGHKSRIKLIEITGDPVALRADIARRVGFAAGQNKST